jgi:hypothetical protein
MHDDETLEYGVEEETPAHGIWLVLWLVLLVSEHDVAPTVDVALGDVLVEHAMHPPPDPSVSFPVVL